MFAVAWKWEITLKWQIWDLGAFIKNFQKKNAHADKLFWDCACEEVRTTESRPICTGRHGSLQSTHRYPALASSSCVVTVEHQTANRGGDLSSPAVSRRAAAMPPLPRLLHRHLSLSLLRLQSSRQPWPTAADAFLRRGLASSSSPASAVAAGREKSSRRTLVYLLGVAAAMVGASYAAVPLYRRFCQATGYGGTVQRREVPLLVRFGFSLFVANGDTWYSGTAHCAGITIRFLIWSMLTSRPHDWLGFSSKHCCFAKLCVEIIAIPRLCGVHNYRSSFIGFTRGYV